MITKAIVFDHRGRSKAGQEGPIEVRITYNSKPYYINTDIKVRGRELRDGMIVGRQDADALNEQLRIVVGRIERAVNRCIEQNLPINVAEIKKQAYNVAVTDASERMAMLNWLNDQVALLNVKDGTRRRYQVLISRLRQYDRLTAWSQLSVEAIYKFDAWLHQITKVQSNGDIQAEREEVKISDASVYNYHKSFGALLKRAVKFGIIESNPYDRLRGEFRKGVTENTEFLSEEEIAAIESLHPIRGTQMAMARDLFIFQVYTGLAYSDTQAFDISDYKMVGGKWLNIGNRIKTGVPYVSQLLPQAVEVLERYGMQVPKINNTQYNVSLKIIQQACGIKTRLHSHLGRHTFGTRMQALGAKLENVQKMMGHRDIRMTQRYAKVLAESVRDDFSKIEEKLAKKPE
ncbi:MAG: tyrosine-type recombinase/integrase [Prevotella sp.]